MMNPMYACMAIVHPRIYPIQTLQTLPELPKNVRSKAQGQFRLRRQLGALGGRDQDQLSPGHSDQLFSGHLEVNAWGEILGNIEV